MNEHFDECLFICPRCGGTYWGTSQVGTDTETGNCHTYGCDFSWLRSNDGEYFYWTAKVNDAIERARQAEG
jgi:hypothetical protein